MLVLHRVDESVPAVTLLETISTAGGPRTACNMLLKPAGIPQNGWFHDTWTV
jgi:hypothetical protein